MVDSDGSENTAEASSSEAETGSRERVRFAEISPRAFEHPADRAALTAMRRVPGFDTVVRKFIGLLQERSLRYLFLASAVRVNERQFSRLHRVYGECVGILDLQERPELYVAQTPMVNAGAVGVDRPFIVLNSGTLTLLDDDELRHVLGHELGHVLSGHVLFKTMLKLLIAFSTTRLGIPLVGLVRAAIIAALTEWDRKSELSSDRAGLLCLQDPVVSYRAFMKMAGGKDVSQMSVDEFVSQAEEYESQGDQLDSLLKLVNLLGVRHPFWVLRLAELKRWVDRGDYHRILEGEYPRRGEDEEEASVVEEFTESAKSYRDSAAESKDPLLQSLRGLGAQLAETGGTLWQTLRSRFAGEEAAEEPFGEGGEGEEEPGGGSGEET